MILISELFEVPEDIQDERALVKWAKSKSIIPKEKRHTLELKENEFAVKMIENSKIKKINPKTGRLKNKNKPNYLKTTIKPEDRTFKNLPRYASSGNDKKGKVKVRFQDWLSFKSIPLKDNPGNHSVALAGDGKYYGWSHRAVYGFTIGDKIKPGDIGNKYRDGVVDDDKETFEPYIIKTDKEALEHAIRFAKEVL